MKILIGGKYDVNYNRTKIIIDGLKTLSNVELSYYNFSEKSKYNLFRLAKACNNADVIFMPSFTHIDVPIVKAVTKKPIIFDPLISRYLSKVFDYKKVSRYSPRAYKNFLKDKLSMQFADVVICDTIAHKNYYEKTFGIDPAKMKVIYVGVNTDDFLTLPQVQAKPFFNVGFYGSFIPLHGTKIIIEAAQQLASQTGIHFTMIGEGVEYENMKILALQQYKLSNISFTGWMKYDELTSSINAFDVALGIFGSSLKTDLVIPNKIFHYAAAGKAIITKQTPAIQELFTDEKNICLCTNTPEDLAASILKLKNNVVLKDAIAKNAQQLVTSNYNHINIANALLAIAEDVTAIDSSSQKYKG